MSMTSDTEELKFFYDNLNTVQSSLIKAVSYAADNWIMFVQFHDNAVYKYESVPPRIYAEFLESPSKGKYFGALIQRIYNYRRLQ
jgi:hypothetical protein